ncbi:hypothetical protein WG68_16250 [Arsukibacterium ikkense]|uniref:Uncharacterized protein n=1 Tax=Arsukibacterium ikkense TaxID=336831 RepID=A0A0M2V5C0_9GAMM|nr:hypothetical protein [Arsukibacterium ikkense]KKO44368.1 hypothetical protein WG68_16250 [Arsukibacterium ikkense]
MQIDKNMFNTITGWQGDNDKESDKKTDFTQILNSLLNPEDEKTDVAATQLVSLLSEQHSSEMQPLADSDAMFAAMTKNMMQSMIESALKADKAENLVEDSPSATPFANGKTPVLGDVIDVVNPLQHIPLVSHYYRDWTGDDIGYLSQVAGGAFWGGAVGVATSFINIGLTSVMNKSPTEYIKQFLGSDVAESSTPIKEKQSVAQNKSLINSDISQGPKIPIT